MKVLYCHGGSGNHGCEAIVRSTYKILGNDQLTLFSKNKDEDEKYKINEITILKKDADISISKTSLMYISSLLETKLFGTTILTTMQKRKCILNSVHKNDIFLSIGGDNYCYPGYEILSDLNYLIHRKGAKTVLWGCSIEPSILNNKKIIADMKRYDLITVRESLSYNGLINAGIKNNVILCSDPAFQLEKIELPLPNNFIKNNTVGINVSPLIISCEQQEGITKENYIRLIEFIIQKTNMNVALIPHVVWNNNDDRKPLFELYKKFENTNRVCMINDCNCMQLKGYIARCRFFIGARTHATIAAYSSCVPTLVVGYSIKAKGIARDIFGTYENYVIPVQSFQKKDDLKNTFIWIYEHEKMIKEHLNNVMPEYCNQAFIARQQLNKILERSM